MDFNTWFYQTEEAEPEKMVVVFDTLMNTLIDQMEVMLRSAYEAGKKGATVEV